MSADFWRAPRADLVRRLGAEDNGLSAAEAARRLSIHGRNEVDGAPPLSWARRYLRKLTSPLVVILLGAAAIAASTGDLISFGMIATMILVSTGLEAMQEHRAEATAAALRASIAQRADAMRDGARQSVPATTLVPGDIVMVTAGDIAPADAIILDQTDLQVNEAVLTGEPYPVGKRHAPLGLDVPLAEAANAVFQGTAIVAGSARLLIATTGKQTRFGMIAQTLAAPAERSPFERDLKRLSHLIARATLLLVLFVLLAQLALGRPLLETFLFAMALAVGLTPELLPVVLTVALAQGAARLSHQRVIVKRLAAIHDLGEMDVLCTDKTGTLTEAKIALVDHLSLDAQPSEQALELGLVHAMFEAGIKSPLDQALLAHADAPTWQKVAERSFDFVRRTSAILARDQTGALVEIVKGAPEAVLARSAYYTAATATPLDAAARARADRTQRALEEKGLRLLGIGYRPSSGGLGDADANDLCFAGFLVFEDPPKASAARAIAALGAHGVDVKVVTGDSPIVARHVMASLGIAPRQILTGAEIAALDEPGLRARVSATQLFARVTPEQKTRVVRALAADGRTTAFLGDGINDAPAIKAADIGLSVDSATDVARQAADIILLAPDLQVLAEGVREGRRVHANVVKFIRMETSSNFGNMLSMAIASLWLSFLPLTAVQVLLNNLFYDISQLGVPMDTIDDQDVIRPRHWQMRDFVRFALVMGPLSSLFDFATFALLLAVWHSPAPMFRTGWFLESVATQVLVVFLIRTSGPAWRMPANRALTATTSLALVAATFTALGPWSSDLGFGTLPGDALGGIVGLAAAYLAAAEITKRWAIRRPRETWAHG